MQTTKTIASHDETEITRAFKIEPQTKKCDVTIRLEGGGHIAKEVDLTDLWDNVMTTTQKNTVRTFFKEIAALAHEVDSSTIIGDVIT